MQIGASTLVKLELRNAVNAHIMLRSHLSETVRLAKQSISGFFHFFLYSVLFSSFLAGGAAGASGGGSKYDLCILRK